MGNVKIGKALKMHLSGGVLLAKPKKCTWGGECYWQWWPAWTCRCVGSSASACTPARTCLNTQQVNFTFPVPVTTTVDQCWGSMTFWCGSGSPDPYLWLMDPDPDPDSAPDPCYFRHDVQDANKKLILKKSFSAFYFLKVHLNHFSKIKSHKTVWIKVFLTIFAWWDQDTDPDPYLWLMDPDPGGPKTCDLVDPDSEHWLPVSSTVDPRFLQSDNRSWCPIYSIVCKSVDDPYGSRSTPLKKSLSKDYAPLQRRKVPNRRPIFKRNIKKKLITICLCLESKSAIRLGGGGGGGGGRGDVL
jgi:hypothetical protein